MTLSRTVARPLLAGMFIYGGWDAVRNSSGKVKKAEPVVLPIAERVPILPQDAEKFVEINGAVMVGAGTLMALGNFRRLAALALIGSIVPTTYAGRRFWEEEDEATRAQPRVDPSAVVTALTHRPALSLCGGGPRGIAGSSGGRQCRHLPLNPAAWSNPTGHRRPQRRPRRRSAWLRW